MLGKRIINSNNAGAPPSSCTTNTNDYPTTNLAYYKMSSAADEKDTYNGTATNVNFNVQGKFGDAGEFNGNSYVTTSLDFSNLTDYSISMWIYIPATLSLNEFFAGTINSTAKNGIYFLINTDNTIRWYERNSSISITTITSTDTITPGSWNNIVAVRDGGTNYLYVNNGTPISASNASITHAIDFTFGRGGAYTIRPLNGKIDQVRIFDSALNATQVTQLYNEIQCVPTIVPTDNFNAVLYTGNGGTQAITNVGFEPNLTWIKQRNGTGRNVLTDSVRGVTEYLWSELTNAEFSYGSNIGLTSFDSNGFTVADPGSINYNVNGTSKTYVAWNWKAGGAAVSNTDGTITSQVSANVDAGFSIVKHTGTGANATVGHGLDSAPELIIYKQTSSSSVGKNWVVYASPLGNTGGLLLNLTSGKFTDPDSWNNTTPTSTVFTLGPGYDGYGTQTNVSGKENIVYCFHSVDGFSKIGSYVGNGSATGPTIVTGFRPAFVIVKNTTGTRLWLISDNKRQTAATKTTYLQAQSNAAEYSPYTWIEYLSNGFQLKNTGSSLNANGNTYIFMAFAEEGLPTVTRNATNPFGDSSEIALYKFEDNANDAEGNYNGTAINVTYASGYIGKAAVFNGSSSYIDLGNSITSGLTNSFTVSLWLKIDASPSVNTTAFSFQRTIWFDMFVPADNILNARLLNSSVGASEVSILNPLINGTWNNVVFVADITNSIVKLYLNGQFQESASWNGTKYNRNQKNVIGAYGTGTVSFFPGSIDQVRIFNRALDGGEVTALYNE